MLLAHNLAFNGLDTVVDEGDHALLEGVHQLRLREVVCIVLRLSDVVEESVHRDDVTLFKLAIVCIVLLDGVVRELHVDLLFGIEVVVVFGVLFRAGANVALGVLVDLSVG